MGSAWSVMDVLADGDGRYVSSLGTLWWVFFSYYSQRFALLGGASDW